MKKDLLLYFALLLWFVVPSQAQPTIFISDLAVAEGTQVVDVSVQANIVDSLIGLQFATKWDLEVLEYQEIISVNPAISQFNFNISNTGRLRLQWEDSSQQGIPFENTTLFTIRFNVIGEPNDWSAIEITGDMNTGGTLFPVEIIAKGLQLITSQTDIDNGSVTIGDPSTSTTVEDYVGVKLYQNTPNPFTEATTIKFEINKILNIQIEISDIVGKTIYLHEERYAPGAHNFYIKNSDLPSTGVYFYRMTSDNFDFTKKMIFN